MPDPKVKKSAIVLIFLGILHFILAGFLEFTWGILLIILGCAAFLYQSRKILPVFGVVLIFAGTFNIGSAINGDMSISWLVFGLIQIVLGISELFSVYKPGSGPRRGFVKIEGEESILKSILRFLLAFFALIVVGVMAYFLTTKTNINASYVIWPFLVVFMFLTIFLVAYNFSTVKNSEKINKWPYEKVTMNEPPLKKMRNERPKIFYSILSVYVLIAIMVCYSLIVIFP